LTRASGLRVVGIRLAGVYVVAFVVLGCLFSWRFTTSAVYPDVDDAIKTDRRAESYLALLKGPHGESSGTSR
jgi:hypothetical protein